MAEVPRWPLRLRSVQGEASRAENGNGLTAKWLPWTSIRDQLCPEPVPLRWRSSISAPRELTPVLKSLGPRVFGRKKSPKGLGVSRRAVP